MAEPTSIPPDIAGIVAAWQRGDHTRAVALTRLWEARQTEQHCAVCGKRLSKANKSGYCREHRDQSPHRRKSRRA